MSEDEGRQTAGVRICGVRMKTLVWAHRGASAYAPENTLESFEKAVQMQADGVELDVQLTRDGALAVAHDERIDRMSDGQGWVKDYTLTQLKAFNFNRTHPEFPRTEMPTLQEVYELLKPTGLTVNVELKTGIWHYDGIEEKVLALTAAEGMESRVIYSSFNHHTLVRLKELDPSVQTGVLYSDEWIGVPAYARDTVHADALHPALYHLQDPTYEEEARKYGLAVHVWTVNEREYMEMLVKRGIEAIITNKPDLCRSVVDSPEV